MFGQHPSFNQWFTINTDKFTNVILSVSPIASKCVLFQSGEEEEREQVLWLIFGHRREELAELSKQSISTSSLPRAE